MSEPIPARRETAFCGTGMETVCEMIVSSSDSEPKVTAVAQCVAERQWSGVSQVQGRERGITLGYILIRCSNAVRVAKDKITSNHQLPGSSGNSVGVAISQPRVEGRSTSTLGKDIKKDSNAVSIAISRRRYPQQDNGQKWVGGNKEIEYNAYG